MKGFVPVTKASLLSMVEECLDALESDFRNKYADRIERYIDQENQRVSTRKWYRLWMLPKPQFDVNSLESLENYSANRPYALYEDCPLKMLRRDRENSIQWVNSLKNIAECEHSGEPILIDIDTFKRISDPFNYNWVNIGIFFTLR
jgi:hypothetical protein